MNIEEFPTLQPTMVTVDLWHVENALFALEKGLDVVRHWAEEYDGLSSLKNTVWRDYLHSVIREMEQAYIVLKDKTVNQP